MQVMIFVYNYYVLIFIECLVGYFGLNCLYKCFLFYYGYLCSQECEIGCELCYYMFGCIYIIEIIGKMFGIKLLSILIVFFKIRLK